MPKQSKIASTKPGRAAPIKEQPDKFYCTRCTRSFQRQKGNFPGTGSPLYAENNGHLSVCRHCVEELYNHYKDVLGDERSALMRICMKFDYYWSDRVYDTVYKANTNQPRILGYISRVNLKPNYGKTFDDTMDEGLVFASPTASDIQASEVVPQEEIEVTQDMIDFWGSGLSTSFYIELERRYRYWSGGNGSEKPMDVGERAVIKQICMLEVTINRDTALGKPIDKSINALNTLLGSANLKPIQKKESLDESMERTPFGEWIRKIENDRPIPEPDPEFRDIDGIVKYISIWFLGHLCKMLKIDNKYSRLYEEEMSRLRVLRPEYEGEDEESMLEDIFERSNRDVSNE